MDLRKGWKLTDDVEVLLGPSVLRLSITRIYPPSIMNQSSEETWFDFLFSSSWSHLHRCVINKQQQGHEELLISLDIRRRRTDLLHHLTQQDLTHVYFLSRDTNTKHRIPDFQKNVVPTEHSQDVSLTSVNFRSLWRSVHHHQSLISSSSA